MLEAARSALEARAVAEAAATLLGAGIRHARVAVSNTGGGTALIWDVQCDTAGRVFTHEVLK